VGAQTECATAIELRFGLVLGFEFALGFEFGLAIKLVG
jgi:hypothetical protein